VRQPPAAPFLTFDRELRLLSRSARPAALRVTSQGHRSLDDGPEPEQQAGVVLRPAEPLREHLVSTGEIADEVEDQSRRFVEPRLELGVGGPVLEKAGGRGKLPARAAGVGLPDGAECSVVHQGDRTANDRVDLGRPRCSVLRVGPETVEQPLDLRVDLNLGPEADRGHGVGASELPGERE